MKKILLTDFLIIGTAALFESTAQERATGNPNFPKMDTSPLDMAFFTDDEAGPLIRILYSRPQKRDREVFGKLVPYGEVWRTGANEATEITLFHDMTVAGETIKAGTYTLYTIPEEKEWTVILNKSTNVWGAYDYHVENDLVRIKVPVRRAKATIEALSMAFEPIDKGTKLLIGWDDRYIEVPFQRI